MFSDFHEGPTYAAVAEHCRRWHGPAFGKPHTLMEPHTTADGERVVVTGEVFDELVGRPRTAVFAVDNGTLRPLTGQTGSARWAKFSPDGESLAFLSDRARPGSFQLFLLRDTGFGEATPVPGVPGTIEYAHWSPDGRSLLLGVAGLGAELSGTQGSGVNTRRTENGPAWHPIIEHGTPESAWRTLWLYSLDTGEISQLSPEGMNCWEAAWCGPSTVLAIASDAPGEDAWYGATLNAIDVATGTSRAVFRCDDAQLGVPAGSPDGRYACLVRAVCSDRWIVAGDLVAVDLVTGEHSVVDTANTDVTWLQWIDPDRLGYLGQRHLDSVAGIVDITTKEHTEVFSTELSCGGGRYPDGAFTNDGRVVVVQGAYHLPPQIALLGAGKNEMLASTANPGSDYLLSVAGTASAISWSAPDGLQIEGILCTPAGSGPFPLVVSIHGGPIWAYRNMWSMRYPWVPLLVSRGYAVLSPNPRGSGGRGQEFARSVVGDMGGADAHDILSGIDALVERNIVDPARVGLIGGSYGGFMSSWLVTQDQRFAAAVPSSPTTDWYSMQFTSNIGGWARAYLDSDPEEPGSSAHTRSPVLRASKVRTPCLLVCGANDRCTPPGQAREFYQALQAHGVESVLATYPQEGHGVRAYPAVIDLLARVLAWFEQHMPPGENLASTVASDTGK
jgi:dipeptidyl aminopeptidase/acylaminoacyl peptidase